METRPVSKEKLINIPNFLTLLRVVLTFVLVYMFLTNSPVFNIMVVFVIAALTDFFDGQIARRFHQVTKFGAKFDILADRLLWITSGIFIISTFYSRGVFNPFHLILMIVVFTREILCFPVALYYFVTGKKVLVHARWSGKTTTFLEGFAVPIVIIDVYYSLWIITPVLVFATFIAGIWAFVDYFRDVRRTNKIKR